MRVLFQPHRIADRNLTIKRLPTLFGYLTDFLRPRTRYFVFCWHDPAPFFKDLRGIRRN
jgi:hypothetical protein